MSADRPRVLVTGAAGRIATAIAPRLRERFQLRLLDEDEPAHDGEDEVLRGDILDAGLLERACAGVDALVHLAAIPTEQDFDALLLPNNLHAVHTVFEAARRAAVRRVVFASTIQTVLGNAPGMRVDAAMPVRPISVYACTKVFGEALARFYVDHHDMSFICLRIGWFEEYGSDAIPKPGMREIWVSPGDMAHMVERCIVAEKVDYAVLFAVSRNRDRFVDIETAGRVVGYEPRDDSSNPPG